MPPRPSRELVAALAARAQAITAEAHGLLAGAMRAAVDAPGGLSGVGAEAVGDVVQYLTHRGEMARDEADRLFGEAEAAQRMSAARLRTRATRRPTSR